MDRVQLVRDVWTAVSGGNLGAVEAALAPDARWRAPEDGPWNCTNRAQIVSVMSERRAAGMLSGRLEDATPVGERVIVAFRPDHQPDEWALDDGIRYVVVSFTGDRVGEIKGCLNHAAALEYAAA